MRKSEERNEEEEEQEEEEEEEEQDDVFIIVDDNHDDDEYNSHLLTQRSADVAEEGEEVKECEVIVIDDDDVTEASQVQKPSDEVLTASLIVLLTVAITRKINSLVKAGCEGCQNDYPAQKDHLDCLWLEWPEKVDKYFMEAVNSMNESDFIGYLKELYNWNYLFDNDKELLIVETVEFFHYHFRKSEILEYIKNRMTQM